MIDDLAGRTQAEVDEEMARRAALLYPRPAQVVQEATRGAMNEAISSAQRTISDQRHRFEANRDINQTLVQCGISDDEAGAEFDGISGTAFRRMLRTELSRPLREGVLSAIRRLQWQKIATAQAAED